MTDLTNDIERGWAAAADEQFPMTRLAGWQKGF